MSRWHILLINIGISIAMFALLYLGTILFLKIHPVRYLDEFFDVANFLIKGVGVLIYLFTAIILINVARSRLRHKSERLNGHLFTLIYCAILFALYYEVWI